MKVSGLTGKELFMLQDTYGFPLELSVEEAQRENIELSANWQTEFDRCLAEQRARSKTASEGMFKGGLEDHSEMSPPTCSSLPYKNLLIHVLGSLVAILPLSVCVSTLILIAN